MAEALLPLDVVRSQGAQPQIPGIENHGMASNELVHKRNKWLHEQKSRGLLQPATLLNLGPFSLQVTAPITYRIPPCPDGKDFAVHVVRTALTLPIYRGAREMHDQSIRHIRDIKGVLPVEQLMEFKRAYGEDTSQDGVGYGGIVVFEGEPGQASSPDNIVRTPLYEQMGPDRFLTFRDERLGDLIESAEQQLKRKVESMLHDADQYADGNEEQRRNLTPDFQVWHDFALRKNYISVARKWRLGNVTKPTDLCQKCGERYVSQTGVCKCGYVRDPLLAYETGEIDIDHVRLSSLSAGQWNRVKAIDARRKAAREGKEMPPEAEGEGW